MAMYVVVETISNSVSYGVDEDWFLCKTVFPDLESAKKSAEKELSLIRGGRWLQEEWTKVEPDEEESSSSCWTRCGQTDDALVNFDVYKFDSNDEANAYEYIGGAWYLE
jgi:hypothetical protein